MAGGDRALSLTMKPVDAHHVCFTGFDNAHRSYTDFGYPIYRITI